MRRIIYSVLLAAGFMLCAHARLSVNLSGEGWKLILDKEAEWKHDPLFLPGDYVSMGDLPYNPPSMGWKALYEGGVGVSVPGTLEEYLTQEVNPQPYDQSGVSWWVKEFEAPRLKKGERALLRFGSVRHRAEVFIDSVLVGYDIVAETPFDVDITSALKPGKEQKLAVRITHPGGNFHWQDFTPMEWGDYRLLPSRGFGGILAPVVLEVVPEVSIADVYVQNLPNPSSVRAVVTVGNSGGKSRKDSVTIRIHPKESPLETTAFKVIPLRNIQPGESEMEVVFENPDVELWSPEHPVLYTMEVSLSGSGDIFKRDFGFRWFGTEGIGKDAMLTLNGHRVMLRSAISWGFWPATGLYPSREMAERQVASAKEMGLNMVNFHRSIGSSIGLEVADSLGIFYLEEPGGFHSASRDNEFGRRMAKTKLNRMVKRDRNHPSLVIYNLINELGGINATDSLLTMLRFQDMSEAHAIDPSRIMTFTSGWAHSADKEEVAKAHFLPFDTTLYLKGWFDNHRAGGAASWEQVYYQSPSDNLMFTDNRKEIFMRGEEGAISTPPRIAKIHEEIQRTGIKGWDGLFWESQYAEFEKYFRDKNLAPYFGDIDSLTRAMGDVQLDHQGRRIQGMRMQDVGDVYVINGWESMPYDNHSGVVDIYRNVKCNVSTICRFTRPSYVAVVPRTQFVDILQEVPIDVYAVNEDNIRGKYNLELTVKSPSGKVVGGAVREVDLEGGNKFGELLVDDLCLTVGAEEGMYRIEGSLLDNDGSIVISGYDEVLAVNDRYENLDLGNGAIYGDEDTPVRQFYHDITGNAIPVYQDSLPALDWVVITRSMLDEPVSVPVSAISPEGFTATYYRTNDIAGPVFSGKESNVNHTFIEGEQPHQSLAANQEFSVIWRGELIAPKDGTYLIGVSSNRGVRLKVNGVQVADVWGNSKDILQSRPFRLKQGEKAQIEVQYSQRKPSGYVRLVWSQPGTEGVDVDALLARAENDGTRILLLDNADSWIDTVAKKLKRDYKGFFTVGRNWVGGVHFVKSSPYFDGLPVNIATGWPYQALVRDGEARVGFEIDDENMIVGNYRSWPFHLGSAMGEFKLGKGKIIYSTLDIVGNLLREDSSAMVARKLFYNLLTK